VSSEQRAVSSGVSSYQRIEQLPVSNGVSSE
jgi:hypothetical protein